MNPGFEADVERLAARAKEFGELVERAGAISADLERELGASGAAWGDDVVGRSFEAAHGAPAAETLGTVRGLADGLGDVGNRFTDAATAYRAGDAHAGEQVSDVGTDG